MEGCVLRDFNRARSISLYECLKMKHKNPKHKYEFTRMLKKGETSVT